MTAELLDLRPAILRRDGPDGEHVRLDPRGCPMYLFGLAYDMGGSEVGLSLWAYSFDDAETRVAAMRLSLRVYGQILEEG